MTQPKVSWAYDIEPNNQPHVEKEPYHLVINANGTKYRFPLSEAQLYHLQVNINDVLEETPQT